MAPAVWTRICDLSTQENEAGGSLEVPETLPQDKIKIKEQQRMGIADPLTRRAEAWTDCGTLLARGQAGLWS